MIQRHGPQAMCVASTWLFFLQIKRHSVSTAHVVLSTPTRHKPFPSNCSPSGYRISRSPPLFKTSQIPKPERSSPSVSPFLPVTSLTSRPHQSLAKEDRRLPLFNSVETFRESEESRTILSYWWVGPWSFCFSLKHLCPHFVKMLFFLFSLV